MKKNQAVCPDSNPVSVMGHMKMGWLSRQAWDNLTRESSVHRNMGTTFTVLVQDQDQSPFVVLTHLTLSEI